MIEPLSEKVNPGDLDMPTDLRKFWGQDIKATLKAFKEDIRNNWERIRLIDGVEVGIGFFGQLINKHFGSLADE